MKWGNNARYSFLLFTIFLVLGCSPVEFVPIDEGSSGLIDDDNTGSDTGGTGGGSGNDPTGDSSGPDLNGFFKQSFTQGSGNKNIDILVVVDNSPSMEEEQSKLGDKFGSFLASLSAVDWQIGVTTTDVSDGTHGIKGSLVNFDGYSSHILTKDVAGHDAIFKDTVERDETIGCTVDCGSGNEQPLQASIMAMEKRDTDNIGFFRDNSDLGIIILSDENEMSDGKPTATTPEQVVDAAEAIWGDTKSIHAFGIIIEPGDSDCYAAQTVYGGHYGTFIADFAALTGGMTGSLCDNDFAPTLSSLGDGVSKLLDYVQLDKTPEAPGETLVEFSPDHTTTWSISGRRIYFDIPPPDGTVITVTFK